jgi:hypothetical protein
MFLSKSEILKQIKQWLLAWDEYNLDAVLEIMHDDVIFENWTGEIIRVKNKLRRSWLPWFKNHGNFKFTKEDIFIDEQEQKVVFQWKLEWPSLEEQFKGKQEIRQGVDVIHFSDGKMVRKSSYSKTTIQIDNAPIALLAQK